jgi:hypothetical protein
MLRTILLSAKNPRRTFVSSLPSTSVVFPFPDSRRVCLFSTAEDAAKILTSAYVKKMLVADLKIELKTRSASMQGKKGDLVERLLKIIEKEKSSSVVGGSTITPETGSEELLQKLDLALSEKNFQLFEETMKEMETAIRSKTGIFLTAEQKEFVFDKLRVWSEMDGIPSESIATVLKSAGYLGFSLEFGDKKSEILVKSIIEKYLKAENKSTRSIAIFFTALNKVEAMWKKMESHIQDRIIILLEMLSDAKDLDARSYSEALMGLVRLRIKWRSLSEEARKKYLSRLNEMKPTLDILSGNVLVKAFTYLASAGKIHPNEYEEINRIIAELSLEGLKLMSSSSSQATDAHEDGKVLSSIACCLC